MSRIRIVGGSITKITKGKHSIYSAENIEYVGQKVTFKGKEGNEFGEATPLEEVFEGISKSPFIASVQFYRSKKQAESIYGIKDTAYKGDFGFDKFDTEIHGEGLVQYYKKFRAVPLNKKDQKKKNYLSYIPYLSIWPPGNPAGLPTKVTLYLQAREASIVRDIKNLKFKLKSSNPNIIVSPQSVKLDVFDSGKNKGLLLVPITVTCIGAFEKDVNIYVYTDDNYAEKVGQLIVYANLKRYQTIIQPVLVNIGTSNAPRKNVNKSAFKAHNIDLDSLVEDFNKRSFNQAYIHAKLSPTLYSMGMKKNLIEDTLVTIDGVDIFRYEEKKSEYNNTLEQRYAASQAEKNTVEKEKSAKALKPLMKTVLKIFDKLYDFNSSKRKLQYIEEKRTNKLITTAWEATIETEAYKKYVEERIKYDKEVTLLGTNALDKTHTIHLFITPGIFCGGFKEGIDSFRFGKSAADIKKDFGAVLAYADTTNGGVVHIFEAVTTKAIKVKEGPSKEYIINSTILHEIGHSLSLHHTFGLKDVLYREPGAIYEEDLERDINKYETHLKRLNLQIKKLTENVKKEEISVKKEGFSVEKANRLTELKLDYDSVRKLIIAPVIDEIGVFSIDKLKNDYTRLKVFEESEESLNLMEVTTTSTRLDLKEAEKIKVTKLIKTKKNKLKNKKEFFVKKLTSLEQKKPKSGTEENYLDYNDNSETMERKIFYKWQWDQIRQFGVSKNFLKPLK
ncbi:hypothetical protein [Tenacibaculum dicentrarchi]|uniref:hypothetical protein n=1 Tax=Tenacibaculum dicentrarchi TaxID=669041 RepID=UPI0035182B1B